MTVDIVPDAVSKAFREQLRYAVEQIGGPKRFSDRAGIPLDSLNKYLARQNPGPLALVRMAEAAGMTVDALLGRSASGSADVNIFDIQAGPANDQGSAPNGFLAIPHLEVRASAGPGLAAAQGEPDPPRQIAFRETWLRSLGITPSNAEFIEARGDSMFPTIQDGDLMLLDRGYGEVVNGKIYVLVVQGLVVVKRVSLLAFGGLMLISDNDRYPAETVPRNEVNNLNFQARVAWFGRPI